MHLPRNAWYSAVQPAAAAYFSVLGVSMNPRQIDTLTNLRDRGKQKVGSLLRTLSLEVIPYLPTLGSHRYSASVPWLLKFSCTINFDSSRTTFVW